MFKTLRHYYLKYLNQKPMCDRIIKFEVQMQHGNDIKCSYVKRRALAPNRKVVGVCDDGPSKNSIFYKVEFLDMDIMEYSANVITDNMVCKFEYEVFILTLMEWIIDYKKDYRVLVSMSDKYVITYRGRRDLRKTASCKLLLKWKDQYETWIPLKGLKDLYLIEVAEYAKARGIKNE